MKVLNKNNIPADQWSSKYIYVGRPTRWGNPWTHLPYGSAPHRVDTREEAIEKYRGWLEEQLAKYPMFLWPLQRAEALVCSCAPLPCHADVLVEYLSR